MICECNTGDGDPAGCLDRARHSEKEHATGTFKGTFRFHPLTAWCDNNGKLLVVTLRPGRVGANTTADHIEVLTAAIIQIPAPHRRRMLIICDGAGATHGLIKHVTLLDACHGCHVHYSVDERIRQVITELRDQDWSPDTGRRGEPPG